MPKKPPQDKKPVPEKRSIGGRRAPRSTYRAAPQSLGSIMQKQGWLQGLARAGDAQKAWKTWVFDALPEELRGALVNVVQKRDELIVLTASAAWSSRMRFAVAALEPEIQARAPDIVKVIVRVSPAGR